MEFTFDKFNITIFNEILNYLDIKTLLNIRLLNKNYFNIFNKCNICIYFKWNIEYIRNLKGSTDTKYKIILNRIESFNDRFNPNDKKIAKFIFYFILWRFI